MERSLTTVKESHEYYLADFEPWAGAKERWEEIVENDLLTEFDQYVYEIFDGEITDQELNDFLWFEVDDWIEEHINGDYDDDDYDDEDLDEGYLHRPARYIQEGFSKKGAEQGNKELAKAVKTIKELEDSVNQACSYLFDGYDKDEVYKYSKAIQSRLDEAERLLSKFSMSVAMTVKSNQSTKH